MVRSSDCAIARATVTATLMLSTFCTGHDSLSGRQNAAAEHARATKLAAASHDCGGTAELETSTPEVVLLRCTAFHTPLAMARNSVALKSNTTQTFDSSTKASTCCFDMVTEKAFGSDSGPALCVVIMSTAYETTSEPASRKGSASACVLPLTLSSSLYSPFVLELLAEESESEAPRPASVGPGEGPLPPSGVEEGAVGAAGTPAKLGAGVWGAL
mmetsp:Transcript_112846/g.314035  ORF Transcript_112846/g.314035 Transcript_112846/m.314035 type:complete len:215 (+) Transcript_112846:366-1010(+)